MHRTKIFLFNRKTNEYIYEVQDCFFKDGEDMSKIMSRFGVRDDKINPELWELDSFKKYDINFPLNLNFNNAVKESLINERNKVVDMCFSQLRTEGDFSSMFIAALNAAITSNTSYYGELKDFYVIPEEDVAFVSKQLVKGFEVGFHEEDNKYQKGIKEIADFYLENHIDSEDIVMILESDDFSLEQNMKDLELIRVKDLLTDKNFKKFVEKFDDEDENLSADEYVSYFLRSKYVSDEMTSRSKIIDCIFDNGFNKNIITEEKIKSVTASQID